MATFLDMVQELHGLAGGGGFDEMGRRKSTYSPDDLTKESEFKARASLEDGLSGHMTMRPEFCRTYWEKRRKEMYAEWDDPVPERYKMESSDGRDSLPKDQLA